MGTVAMIIFVLENDPLVGAFGSAGATAVTLGATLKHGTTNGWVVSRYLAGGSWIYQLAGSGVTVTGGALYVPVAMKETSPPLETS